MAFKMAGFSAFTKPDDKARKTDRIPQVVQHMQEELVELENKEASILENVNQSNNPATEDQRNQLANLHQKQLKLRNKLKKYK